MSSEMGLIKLDFYEIPFQHCCNNFSLAKEERVLGNLRFKNSKARKLL